MKVRYPATLTCDKDNFRIKFTDFAECEAEGKTLKETVKDAKRILSYQIFLYNQKSVPVPEPSQAGSGQITIETETIEKEKELPLTCEDEEKSEKKKLLISSVIKIVLLTMFSIPLRYYSDFFSSVQLIIISVFCVIQTIYVIDDIIHNKTKELWWNALITLICFILITVNIIV